jgi:2-methylisocitrate lyase-like PEP mutase family enzyme
MVRRGVSLARLAAIGVRRVSYATSLFREILAAVEQQAVDVQAAVEQELETA